MSTKGMIWAIIGVVMFLLFLMINPIVLIGAGERGVVLNLGAVSDTIMNEGLNFRTPFIQSVKVFDIKMQKDELETGAASKDLQEVKTTIALNYHIYADKVNKLYQYIGSDFKKRIIDPAIQDSVKAATAKFTAEEAITKRQAVREEIKRLLTERLQREYIAVDEVSITDFDFSSEFNKAIEIKVTAEQQALKAKNDLERIKTEAEQRIAQAKGEAEAIRIQAESISKQGGQSYVQLKAIEKWNGALPVQMIPNATVPFLDLNQKPDTNQK